MTPAQRQYDLDLASSMIAMSKRIEPMSAKVADTLKLGAERITALTASVPIEPLPPLPPSEPPNVVTAKSSPRQHRQHR